MDRKIVLLHGIGVDHRMWEFQRETLSELGEVMNVDLPGFGKTSPLTEADTSIDGYVDWLAGKIRERGWDKSIIVGYSMGGSIALRFCLTHPSMVSGAAICCSSPYWGIGLRKMAAMLYTSLLGNFSMDIFQWVAKKHIRPMCRSKDEFDRIKDMMDLASRPVMYRLYRDLAAMDQRKRVGELDRPTLVVGGALDLLAPKSHLKSLDALLPNSRLEIIKGADHFACLGRREEFNYVLTRFISKI